MLSIAHPARLDFVLDNLSGTGASLISIATVTPLIRYSLRLRPDLMNAFATAHGIELGGPINSCVAADGISVARLGPDEWLVLALERTREVIETKLNVPFADRRFSLVDISHRHVALSVCGPCARDIINSGCPLDLSETAFPANSASRTLLCKAEIVLIRDGMENNYHIECERSFGPYVNGILRQVAREFEDTAKRR